MSKKPNNILRWILRGFSGVIIAFSILFFLGENLDSESSKPMTANSILQLSVFGTGLIGFMLAWKWELIGGILALMAFVVLAIINPTVLNSTLMLIFPVTAILFIVLWAMSSKSLKDRISKLENRP